MCLDFIEPSYSEFTEILSVIVKNMMIQGHKNNPPDFLELSGALKCTNFGCKKTEKNYHLSNLLHFFLYYYKNQKDQFEQKC